MLEDKGFFTEADIVVPPAGEGDSDGEEDSDANHLIEKLLLAEGDVRIEYAQPANNVSRTSPYDPILVETSRTIIGPK